MLIIDDRVDALPSGALPARARVAGLDEIDGQPRGIAGRRQDQGAQPAALQVTADSREIGVMFQIFAQRLGVEEAPHLELVRAKMRGQQPEPAKQGPEQTPGLDLEDVFGCQSKPGFAQVPHSL